MAVVDSAIVDWKASDQHQAAGLEVNLRLPLGICGEMPAKSLLQPLTESPIKSPPASSTKKSKYFNQLVCIGARSLGQVRAFGSSTHSGKGSGKDSGSDPGSYTGYLARCGT